MKPFNLERALAGDEVVDKDGRAEYGNFYIFKETGLIAFEIRYPNRLWILGQAETESDAALEDLRMKPRTIKVNGFEIEAGESGDLATNQVYYMPAIDRRDCLDEVVWCHDSDDAMCLKRGLVHLTEGNAIAHAKAMLGIDPKDSQ